VDVRTREAVDVRTAEGVRPSRMWSSDLILEAFAGIFARPGRMVMTILGTMIGLTALVATLGLSRTASAQIISRFDELAATEITVSSRPAGEGQPTNELPWDASERIRRLNGVVAVGTLSAVDVRDALVSASPFVQPGHRSAFGRGGLARAVHRRPRPRALRPAPGRGPFSKRRQGGRPGAERR